MLLWVLGTVCTACPLEALPIGFDAGWQLQDHSLHFVHSCSATLRQLALVGITRVTDEALCSLLAHLPHLQASTSCFGDAHMPPL